MCGEAVTLRRRRLEGVMLRQLANTKAHHQNTSRLGPKPWTMEPILKALALGALFHLCPLHHVSEHSHPNPPTRRLCRIGLFLLFRTRETRCESQLCAIPLQESKGEPSACQASESGELVMARASACCECHVTADLQTSPDPKHMRCSLHYPPPAICRPKFWQTKGWGTCKNLIVYLV